MFAVTERLLAAVYKVTYGLVLLSCTTCSSCSFLYPIRPLFLLHMDLCIPRSCMNSLVVQREKINRTSTYTVRSRRVCHAVSRKARSSRVCVAHTTCSALYFDAKRLSQWRTKLSRSIYCQPRMVFVTWLHTNCQQSLTSTTPHGYIVLVVLHSECHQHN